MGIVSNTLPSDIVVAINEATVFFDRGQKTIVLYGSRFKEYMNIIKETLRLRDIEVVF